MSRSRIEKYAIYATRLDEDHRWFWWARPPWSAPVRFRTWGRAAAFLRMHHELRQKERS